MTTFSTRAGGDAAQLLGALLFLLLYHYHPITKPYCERPEYRPNPTKIDCVRLPLKSMLLVLILLGACAYLWSDNRKLLELRIADAMRSSREKGDEVKSKDAQVLALTSEIDGLEKQLLLLSQVNDELERRMGEAEDEVRIRAAELEDMREAESDMKAFYATVVATKDKELAMLESGLGREIQKLLKDKEEAEAARDELEQKNLELRDRVSEYHRRVNDGSYIDEAREQSRFQYGYSSPHQGHRRHGAIGGVQESEREASSAQPDTKIWGYTVPHGMGL